MVGAVAAGAGGLRQLDRMQAQAALAVQDVSIPTCCNMCGGTTGIYARVYNGRVITIEPNSFNPVGICNISTDYVNPHSTGARMCPKGNAGIMSLYDPDRVKKPLKRVGQRGSGQWQQIGYDQAITEVAARLAAIKANYGPERVLWFTEDNTCVPIQEALCNTFGTPNFLQHSNLCDVARTFGFERTLGHGRPLPDLRNTKYMLIFGWNPIGAMKWAHLPRILLDGLSKGAKLVIVDPRCSETALKALDYRGMWLPIRPGTDGALALAMANVIINERLYDASFVATWTVGFDKFTADSLLPLSEVMQSVGARTEMVPDEGRHGNGPAVYYRLPRFGVTVGFIGAMTNQHFCDQCNKMRLTADGTIRPCLGHHSEFDLKPALRELRSATLVREVLSRALTAKPARHLFCDHYQPGRIMTAIGG